MTETYLIIVTLIFLVGAFIRLRKLGKSFYPRRPRTVAKNEDKAYFVIYLIFVAFGLIIIFVP